MTNSPKVSFPQIINTKMQWNVYSIYLSFLFQMHEQSDFACFTMPTLCTIQYEGKGGDTIFNGYSHVVDIFAI